MKSFAPISLALLLLGSGPAVQADIPWEEAKKKLREENARLAARPEGHAGVYFVICTVYYTPTEAGITAERGFDVTPTTAPGLRGRHYPKDFLRVVKLEGYGRLLEPVDGKGYLFYDGDGRYGFAREPGGMGGRFTLVPRVSAAARLGQRKLKEGAELITKEAVVREIFGSDRWKIVDTGGGLKRWQLDLYWGEDEPRGPDALGRPKGTEFEYCYAEIELVEPD